MTATSRISLVTFENSGLILAQPGDDVRGLTVVDPHLHRVGEVDGFIVDEGERRPRLLVVASGGILGLARSRRLVPVEAVTLVDDRVHIEASHEHVHRCAVYDPEAASPSAYDEVYSHYGYLPFWRPGYVNPYFLRLP